MPLHLLHAFLVAGASGVSCEALNTLTPQLTAGSQLQLAAAAPGSFSLSSPAGVLQPLYL
jgi:hypothetical protein